MLEIGTRPAAEIIEHAHKISVGDEGLHNVGSDKTGAACYQISHTNTYAKRFQTVRFT